MKEVEEDCLNIKITEDCISGNLTGKPNLELGFISRARYELDEMEKLVFEKIKNNAKA